MVPISIAVFQFDGVLGTLGQLGFVINLMALVFVIYRLYLTFAEHQLLFMGSSLVAAYFAIFDSFLVIGLAIFLLVIDPQFINSVVFGAGYSIQGLGQMHEQMQAAGAQERMKTVQNMMQEGEAVDPEEMAWYQQQQGQQGGGPQGGQMNNPAMYMRRPGT